MSFSSNRGERGHKSYFASVSFPFFFFFLLFPVFSRHFVACQMRFNLRLYDQACHVICFLAQTAVTSGGIQSFPVFLVIEEGSSIPASDCRNAQP